MRSRKNRSKRVTPPAAAKRSSRRTANAGQALARPLLRRLSLPVLAFGGAAAATLYAPSAMAQIQFGAIQGIVTNQDNGKPLPGVTVVVSGPALQGDQTEVSDSGGRYLITQLPPGDNYVIRYYFNDVVIERPGVRISLNKTLTVPVKMPTTKGRTDKIVLRERAPNVDTATANTGVEVTQEILQNTAVRGRTYESVMSLAPGSADVAPRAQAGGDVGVSFSGAVGNENAVIIDGLNTTDLNTGVVATQLHQYFIKDIQVITGGYQAEYGRATGGVISIATKTGSNEFHGGVFGAWAPYQATPNTVARLGEALGTRTRQLHQYDFGFELGGPIVKDRIWFYAGFAPTFTITGIDRVLRTRIKGARQPDGTFLPERDMDYRAPGYLSDPALSAGLEANALRTTEIGSQELREYQRIYNWIGKLQFNINPDHNITLGYIGAPQVDHYYNGNVRNDPQGLLVDRAQQVHDGTVHYIGKLFERKLQIDVLYGYHFQGRSDVPNAINTQQIRYRAAGSDAYSLADFENVPECRRDGSFNPCPITDYFAYGYGQFVLNRVLQRHALQASGTLFVNLLGNHAFKLGFDFEDNLSDNTRKYTGTDFDPNSLYSGRVTYTTNADGSGLRTNRGFALPDEVNRFGDRGTPCPIAKGFYCYDYFRAVTETRNYALYLRDSWNVSFLPGFVVNAGIRWEIQDVYGADGSKQISLLDNLAPRAGFAWDPTKKGRAKIYGNYGRFFQSIPMDINDRAFSGEGLLVGRGFAGDCPTRPHTPGGRPLVVPDSAAGLPCSLSQPRVAGSGVFAPVQPGLKGQYLDEFVAGGQYDVGWDIVVGAFYTYRTLGQAVEDLSVNGGETYFIANPGAVADPAQVKQLEDDLAAAKKAAEANPNSKDLAEKAAQAERRLEVTKAVALFPPPKREYHAITFTINKRLSNRFSILANYTYSRLTGNFPGPFNPYNNQLDPNITTQYDIIDLLVNRDGPLNNDRPHNLKATGFYMQPLFGGKGTLTASLTFTALSGRPIQVLGQHTVYGARETFILPSGSGGRTPMITQMDAHIGYDHQLTDQVKATLYVDVINLFNQQEVINVDDEYTFSFVDPIRYGKPEDLKKLRSPDGSVPVLNSNYGQPTAYQAPLYLRVGARLAF
mgnify:CR=1 FL=1